MKKLQLKDIPDKDILIQQNKWTENNRKSGAMIRKPQKDYDPNFPFTYEAFPQWPEKLVYKKMEQLAERGFLDYGVSLRTAWLTHKGLEIIERINNEE